MEATRPRVRLLVTDLDNTLFDWFRIWHSSFSTLIDEVSRQSGLRTEVLLRDARAVHQRRRTAEYAFLLDEMACLRDLHPGEQVHDLYRDAIHRYRSARKRATQLYPTVRETLEQVTGSGVPIVAYTDSLAFYSLQRLKRLSLDGVIDALYSPPDHDLPEGRCLNDIRTLSETEYELQRTRHKLLPEGAAKPDPRVLKTICADYGVAPAETAFVGDSLMKDVAMAQDARVIDVLAEYGIAHQREEYELLQQVSHWTEADVRREQALAESREVTPRFVLQEHFSELLDLVDLDGSPR